jgi:integrase/recombinase XerD
MEKKMTKVRTTNTISVAFEMTLEDLFQEFLLSREAAGASKRTVSWYTANIERFIDFCKGQGCYTITQVDSRVINLFLQRLRETPSKRDAKPLSALYIHGYARTILTMFRYANDVGYIETVPKVMKPKLVQKKLPTLSVEEVQQILNACLNTRDKLLILLAVDSGLRLTEMASLKWKDVDMRTGRIEVLCGKGGKYRVSAIGKQTLRMMLKYNRELNIEHPRNTDPDQHVFQTDEYAPLGPRSIQSAFLRIKARSGVAFSPHALRRTFAKMSAKSGMNILIIQQLMGHNHVETTRKYIQQLDDEDILEGHRSFGVVDHLLM